MAGETRVILEDGIATGSMQEIIHINTTRHPFSKIEKGTAELLNRYTV